MSASAQLSRLLALVPWLRAHPGVSLSEAAAEFGVSVKQLEKDLNLLIVCGLPRQGPEDLIDIQFWGDGIDVLDPQSIARPLRLAPDEAVSLMVGLRLLRDLPGRHDPEVVDRLLARLSEAAGDAAAPSERIVVAVGAEDEATGRVRQALAEGRALRLRYLVPRRDEETERVVDPIRVIAQDGRSYLEAWCRRAEDLRLFRLDRVIEATVTDEPARVPDAAGVRDVTDGMFRPADGDLRVVIEVGPSGRWLADYVQTESVTELPDGGLLVEFRTPDTRWVLRLATRLGSAGRIVEPAELETELGARASRLLAEYGTD